MPKFRITTDNSKETNTAQERIEFPNTKAATDDAQVALGEMVRDKLPDGKHADFGVQVENEAGKEVYRATLTFDARSEEDIDREGEEADAAADDVASSLGRSGPRE